MDVKEIIKELVLLLSLLDGSKTFPERQDYTVKVHRLVFEHRLALQLEDQLSGMTSTDAKRRCRRVLDEYYYRDYILSRDPEIDAQRRERMESNLRDGTWTRADAWTQMRRWNAGRFDTNYRVPER